MPCWPMLSRPFDRKRRCCDRVSAFFVWNTACVANHDTFDEQEITVSWSDCLSMSDVKARKRVKLPRSEHALFSRRANLFYVATEVDGLSVDSKRLHREAVQKGLRLFYFS